MTADSKETVFSRWSRRKQEARQEIEDKPPETPPEASSQITEDRVAEAATEADQPVLTDADMPDIESLDENSDFSPFMSSGVSDKLRNLALRKLFHAPVFNIRDGLDEYDEDFTSFEKLGNVVTADMKHRLEMEQQKLREKLAEKQAAEDAEAPVETAEARTGDEADAGGESDDEDEAAAQRVASLDAAEAADEKPGDER